MSLMEIVRSDPRTLLSVLLLVKIPSAGVLYWRYVKLNCSPSMPALLARPLL